MTAGLKIKDVAEQSGFTQATLRYDERIGLLRQASRTSGGDRVYDERAVELRLCHGSCR